MAAKQRRVQLLGRDLMCFADSSRLAVLVFAVQPTLTNAQVVDLLQKNNDDLGAVGYDLSFGYGRGNVYKTLTAARAATPVIDTTPPSGSITSPTNNSRVSGTVNIAVTATDNIGISKVEI